METKKPSVAASGENELLKLFKEFYDKQDIVQRLSMDPSIHGYGLSEQHCIEAVGILEHPNVSLIAQALDITRGAACKITKKLMAKGDIRSYQLEGNKKEIYFTLTEKGKSAFRAHEISHRIWFERDLRFLQTVSQEEKKAVISVLRRFISFLQDEIAAIVRSSDDSCRQKGESDGSV